MLKVVIIVEVVNDRHSSNLLNGKEISIRAILRISIRIGTAHPDARGGGF